jgi:hypothetical protein
MSRGVANLGKSVGPIVRRQVKERKMKAVGLTAILLTGLLAAAAAPAQPGPAKDINAKHHPNLAAAQRLSAQAFERISAAQTANEFDMGGHAAHAKELLDEANKELRAAANMANANAK